MAGERVPTTHLRTHARAVHLGLDADLLDAEEEERDEELRGDGRLASTRTRISSNRCTCILLSVVRQSTRAHTEWFHVSASCPHSARGSSVRKIVRKRAVSRVYTRGMGDLKMRSLAPVRSTSVEIVWSIRAEYMGSTSA